jgi:hypothetical protein
MNGHAKWLRPGAIGALVLLLAVVVLFVFSDRLTGQLYSNLQAAGINPQGLQVYNPITGKPIRG